MSLASLAVFDPHSTRVLAVVALEARSSKLPKSAVLSEGGLVLRDEGTPRTVDAETLDLGEADISSALPDPMVSQWSDGKLTLGGAMCTAVTTPTSASAVLELASEVDKGTPYTIFIWKRDEQTPVVSAQGVTTLKSDKPVLGYSRLDQGSYRLMVLMKDVVPRFFDLVVP